MTPAPTSWCQLLPGVPGNIADRAGVHKGGLRQSHLQWEWALAAGAVLTLNWSFSACWVFSGVEPSHPSTPFLVEVPYQSGLVKNTFHKRESSQLSRNNAYYGKSIYGFQMLYLHQNKVTFQFVSTACCSALLKDLDLWGIIKTFSFWRALSGTRKDRCSAGQSVAFVREGFMDFNFCRFRYVAKDSILYFFEMQSDKKGWGETQHRASTCTSICCFTP